MQRIFDFLFPKGCDICNDNSKIAETSQRFKYVQDSYLKIAIIKNIVCLSNDFELVKSITIFISNHMTFDKISELFEKLKNNTRLESLKIHPKRREYFLGLLPDLTKKSGFKENLKEFSFVGFFNLQYTGIATILLETLKPLVNLETLDLSNNAFLHKNEFYALLTHLSTMKKLKHLNLNKTISRLSTTATTPYTPPEDEGQEFKKMLKSLQLVSLEIGDNNFGQDLSFVIESLPITLEYLNMSDCRITDIIIASLQEKILTLTNLKELNLGGNDVIPKNYPFSLEKLNIQGRLFSTPYDENRIQNVVINHLKELNVSNTSITKAFALSLPYTLTSLVISECLWQAEAFEAFISYLEQSYLTVLDVRTDFIVFREDQDATMGVQLLQKLPNTLTHLNLKRYCMKIVRTPPEFNYNVFKPLQKLDLTDNIFEEEFLHRMFENCDNLIDLNLTGINKMEISSNTFDILIKLLKRNRVEKLTIDRLNIDFLPDCYNVGQLIDVSHEIKHIGLQGVLISGHITDKISEALSSNQTLESIDLSNNRSWDIDHYNILIKALTVTNAPVKLISFENSNIFDYKLFIPLLVAKPNLIINCRRELGYGDPHMNIFDDILLDDRLI